MDGNPEQQLTETIKHCLETARNLKEEYESLLQKQKSTYTTGDSDHSVKQTPLVNDVTKQLKDNDLALDSNLQQLKLALEQYLHTKAALLTSEDSSTIQSDYNQKQIAKDTINQQVKLSNDNNVQNEANLNPTSLFTGTLPDDVYLYLMSFIGIQECLLSNRLVCSFWNELVLDRCSNQKSLKLFESFDNLMEYGEWLLKYEKTDETSLILKSIGDDLIFEALEIDHWQLVKSLKQEDDGDVQTEVLTRKRKLEASKVLTVLFPRVEELVLITGYETLINIEHLLQFYAEKLTSLTMKFSPYDESPASRLRPFSFPKLKSLNTFNFSPEKEQFLSLLPQLESLTLRSTKISLESLLRTGNRLRELNLNGDYGSGYISMYTAPVDEFSRRPPINTNLRKFSFVAVDNELPVFKFISRNLTSLECLKLDLRFDQNNASDLNLLSPYLAPLHQLHSLTLEANVSFFLLDDNQLAKIKPLPSVRHLKLLLWNYASLHRESMDLFTRALFTAFPHAEQALIAFVGHEDDNDGFVFDGRVDADTFAAFEAFAGKHPNVVQLFRSKNLSKFTKLPNAVSPLLGHHRQVYEEYIEEEELFGVSIGKLTAYLVTRQGEDGPNLKVTLRPADRLTAMSNLLQLLESKAFAFTYEKVYAMIYHLVQCALNYDASQFALFTVTCKCVLFLLDCSVVDTFNSDKETPFLEARYWQVYPFFEMLLNLVKHSMTQQFDDKNLLLQLCKRMVQLLTEFDSFWHDVNGPFDEYKLFKILLKLAHYYQTEQLNILDSTEKLRLQINKLINDQLQTFEWEERLDEVIIKLIHSKNRVYQVETVRALLRCCESTDSYFKLLGGEADGDSSEGDTSDRDTSYGSSSSAESEL